MKKEIQRPWFGSLLGGIGILVASMFLFIGVLFFLPDLMENYEDNEEVIRFLLGLGKWKAGALLCVLALMQYIMIWGVFMGKRWSILLYGIFTLMILGWAIVGVIVMEGLICVGVFGLEGLCLRDRYYR